MPKPDQPITADGTEGAHVGVARAIEGTHREPGQLPGRDLVPRDAPGLALAAHPRPDDEVVSAGPDRLDQRCDARRIIGTVAVHEHDDVGIGGGVHAGRAGAPIAAPDADHVGASAGRARGGRSRCFGRRQR